MALRGYGEIGETITGEKVYQFRQWRECNENNGCSQEAEQNVTCPKVRRQLRHPEPHCRQYPPSREFPHGRESELHIHFEYSKPWRLGRNGTRG